MAEFPDFLTTKGEFFLSPTDTDVPENPGTYSGCKVTPLVDGVSFNHALADALDSVGTQVASNPGDFIYIANWWFGLISSSEVDPDVTDNYLLTTEGVGVSGGDPYLVDRSSGLPSILRDVLVEKANRGVDVRILGWIHPGVIGSELIRQQAGVGGAVRANSHTLNAIQFLRKEPKIGFKALMNVLGHPAGAVHNKLIVIGTSAGAVAFTGGIDLSNDRRATPDHLANGGGLPYNRWHDVAVKMEGPAVQGAFNHFRSMYNENLRRPLKEVLYKVEVLPHRNPTVSPEPAEPEEGAEAPIADHHTSDWILKRTLTLEEEAGTQHVQSLRTIPQAKYTLVENCIYTTPPTSFATQGLFEIRHAWRKAILNAEKYIYMEDQAFTSAEVLGWIGEAVKNKPDLKVILVTSSTHDPNDPAGPNDPFLNAIHTGLLRERGGATDLTPAQIERMKVFQRFSEFPLRNLPRMRVTAVAAGAAAGTTLITTDIIVPASFNLNDLKSLIPKGLTFRIDLRYYELLDIVGSYHLGVGIVLELVLKDRTGFPTPSVGEFGVFTLVTGMIVHSKLTLIDDRWAIVGSANCMRRSLYTDWEHSAAFIDQDDADWSVKELRKKLWAEHLLIADPNDLDDLNSALQIWSATWRPSGIGALPGGFPAGEVFPHDLILLKSVPLTVGWSGWTGNTEMQNNLFLDADSREDWGLGLSVIWDYLL